MNGRVKPRNGDETKSMSAIIRELYELRNEKTKLLETISILTEKSLTDPLTGLGNRRKMHNSLSQYVAELTREKKPLSVMAIDMNNLKLLNDSFGHAHGDNALLNISDALKSTIRINDVACRTGGDEFVVILPGTDKPGANRFANRLKARLSEKAIDVSIGVATESGIINRNEVQSTVNKMLYDADARMYNEKT
ncbi:MAG: GGDEF domain-containing protein, partial [Candidatus Micrarchaeaceae archaeon]